MQHFFLPFLLFFLFLFPFLLPVAHFSVFFTISLPFHATSQSPSSPMSIVLFSQRLYFFFRCCCSIFTFYVFSLFVRRAVLSFLLPFFYSFSLLLHLPFLSFFLFFLLFCLFSSFSLFTYVTLSLPLFHISHLSQCFTWNIIFHIFQFSFFMEKQFSYPLPSFPSCFSSFKLLKHSYFFFHFYIFILFSCFSHIFACFTPFYTFHFFVLLNYLIMFLYFYINWTF